MSTPQPAILAAPPEQARFLLFDMRAGDVAVDDVRETLSTMSAEVDGMATVLGLGAPLLSYLECDLAGLRSFPAWSGKGVAGIAQQHCLWLWLRGRDQGELMHRSLAMSQLLAPAFQLIDEVQTFKYRSGRDLTGYIDGTENPTGQDAIETAIISNGDPALEASSFVTVQRWQHDFSAFSSMPQSHQNDVIGRRLSDNEELDDAPISAHVKRTAQESFDPEAFLLRRSMPWSDGQSGGLQFVAFANTLDAFEAQWRRMLGLDDGVCDALFSFSRALNGAHFWCPAIKNGRLQLSLLGID